MKPGKAIPEKPATKLAKEKEIAQLSTLALRLEERLLSGWPAGGWLPPISALSRELKCSPGTLLAALRQMVARGKLRQDEGWGRYGLPSAIHTSKTKPDESKLGLDGKTSRHRVIAAILREEIFRGIYAMPGGLPPLKGIQERFGCNHRTLALALGLLVEQRLLRRQGRSYKVATSSHRRPTGTQVYLTGMPRFFLAGDFQHTAILRGIERELHFLGWGGLEIYATASPGDGDAPPDERVSGFVNFFDTRSRKWLDFLRAKSRQPGLSTVMINLTETGFDNPAWQGYPKLRSLSPDNHRAGMEMGSWLRSLGHEHIAFFAHSALDWPDARHLHRLHPQWHIWGELPLWASHRFRGLTEHFAPREPDEAGTADTKAPRLTLFDGHDLPQAPHPTLEGIPGDPLGVARLGALQASMLRLGFPASFVAEGLNPAYSQIEFCRLGRKLEPLFHRALADPSITAWIGLNDDVAFQALFFLERLGKRVPEDISVCGFDNRPLAYRLGLTSYDFCLEEIGHLAVRALAFPKLVKGDAYGRSQAPGRLMPRRSTAAAAGRGS